MARLWVSGYIALMYCISEFHILNKATPVCPGETETVIAVGVIAGVFCVITILLAAVVVIQVMKILSTNSVVILLPHLYIHAHNR